MRTVTYQSVFNGASLRAGLDPTTLSTVQGNQLAEFITSWAKKAWEWDFWPEWTPLEQRAYRDPYNSETVYAASTVDDPVEVWFPPAQMYAQALQATTGNDPFINVAGVWVANCPYWDLSQGNYAGDPWEPATNYVQGTVGVSGSIIQNPGDDNFYECITTHTSGGSFDPSKFTVLTVFERYVSLDQAGRTPIGEVSNVFRNNPRTNQRNPGKMKVIINNHGILPPPLAGQQVWVLFRLRPPQFTNTAYVAETAYGLGDVVLRATTGECYVSLEAGNSGNTPEDSPDEWQKQDMPEVIAEIVKVGALSNLIRGDGQNEKADDEEERANTMLSDAVDVTFASQGQYSAATAETY